MKIQTPNVNHAAAPSYMGANGFSTWGTRVRFTRHGVKAHLPPAQGCCPMIC